MEQNNYLYFIIKDDEQNIRCNIIGTCHNVDQKDAELNTTIIEAIVRSSRAILEMPPGSKLIPSNSDLIIDKQFKKISLEENINKIIQSNKECEILPLENIDLANLIEIALSKGSMKPLSEEDQILLQTLQKELYTAWVKGDTEELKKLYEKSSELFPEPQEFKEIHEPRDLDMAKRIVDVILDTEKKKECLVVVGDAHLLYSHRKNVLAYLDDRFKGDLNGWTITQVKVV